MVLVVATTIAVKAAGGETRDNMKVEVEVELQPFEVPNLAVHRVYGTAMSIELSSIPTETLAAMCQEFTHAVFAKAGKKNPPMLIWGGDARSK